MTTPVEVDQSLKYKTWVLKVSIHCEGCKKKVKKVLHNVEGVYKVDIEAKQHKVTVIGNVEGETLIKKLMKSGKPAELVPEKTDQKEKKSGKSKNKEKQSNPESSEQVAHGGGGDHKEKTPLKVEVVQDPAQTSGGGGGAQAKTAKNRGGGGGPESESGGAAATVTEAAGKTSGGGGPANESGEAATVTEAATKTSGGGQPVESKSEGKKPETGSTGEQSLTAEKKDGESEGGAEKSGNGNGSGGKKKKNKGQNGNTNVAEGEPSSGGAAASTGLHDQNRGTPLVSASTNQSPPRQHGYYHPPHHYAPPPVYSVNYNTAHPTTSNTASYYANPPPYQYAYTYPSEDTELPPPSDLYAHPRQPLDSFEYFSDENPNGCSIM